MTVVLILGALLWADQYYGQVNPEAAQYYERRNFFRDMGDPSIDDDLEARLKKQGKKIKRAPAKSR